jgi:NADH dehydrogenase [ubiquinone] 1 alpha subcomplex assembly factor 7
MDTTLMAEVTPLEAEIRRRIAAAGPMPVGEYMTLCLTDRAHGYYVTRDPLGQRGDFITAPEVSQMFGELIGLWMAAVWKQMGEPANVRIIELGPGRGTMMSDALRATRVMPAFRAAIVLHLVEISPVLQTQQERTLEQLPVPMFWHPTLMDVPAGPAIIVANEFFDALPVNQAVKTERGWHERCIEIDSEGKLAFTLAPNPVPQFDRLLPPAVREAANSSIFEWRSDTVAMEMGRRIARDGGAALVIDYGHANSAVGETLQAVGQHTYANPLIAPGTIDLTAHVDFEALARAVEPMGANSFGPIEQSEFLRRLGIETRAAALKVKAAGAFAAGVDAALARLTGRSRAGMGALFKAAAYAHPLLGVPPGFEG